MHFVKVGKFIINLENVTAIVEHTGGAFAVHTNDGKLATIEGEEAQKLLNYIRSLNEFHTA